MAIRWKGLIAPTEVPTGDGRMFASGKLTSRPTPIPLMVRFGSGGHEGATVVGKVNRIYDGPGGYWADGEFLDPSIVPEVPKAIYMLQNKVMGPSVDLDRDFTVEAVKHPTRPDKRAGLFKEYNVIGVTLVPMPAFHQVHMSIDSDEEKALVASIMPDLDMSDWEPFAVNGESWKGWPIAPRAYKFDADDAVKRIAYWAGIGSKEPSLDKYASAFLWRNGNQVGDTLAQDSFRLPLCDIINNEPHLIYHAAYAAAALLSGAHGGLPNIPAEDRQAMIPVINEIYTAIAQAYGDPNLRSPFQEHPSQAQYATEDDCGCDQFAQSLPLDVDQSVLEEVASAMDDGIPVKFTVPGLAPNDGNTACAALQECLSCQINLMLLLKHAHWNVTGPFFIGVHKMLDDQVETVEDLVDEIAERITTLGAVAIGTADSVTAHDEDYSYPVGRATVAVHLAALNELYDRVITKHREAMNRLGGVDLVTQNMLMGQVQQLEHLQWLIRAHLESPSGELATTSAGY